MFSNFQRALYKKKSVGLPYLEGNYFKEENIYDELTANPKGKKLVEENVYDEIKGTSSKVDKASSEHYNPNDEPLYQSVPYTSSESPESKSPSSEFSSLNSNNSSAEGQQQESVPKDAEASPERESKSGDSDPPSSAPRYFENPSYSSY